MSATPDQPGRPAPAGRVDLTGRLLDRVATALPAHLADWAHAMAAELAAIDEPRERRRFARGCLRAVLSRPAVLARAAWPALTVAVLATAVALTGPATYLPLRVSLIGVVVVLLVLTGWARRPGVLGPVAPQRPARVVRALASVFVLGLALSVVEHLAAKPDPRSQLANGVPILGVILAGYLLGFLVLTAGPTAATARMIGIATAAAASAGGAWLIAVVLWPPIPASTNAAVVAVLGAMVVTAILVSPDGSRHAVTAALGAGAVAAPLIVVELLVVASYAPASMIPDLVGVALAPADNLAQSRIELEDPYVGLLVIGWLIAIGLTVAGGVGQRSTRRRAVPAGP